ncbi:ribose-phosphate diphosphokinase [Candidatus Vidania fulgoroideorum]
MLFFYGNNCKKICIEVSKFFKINCNKIFVERFSDGEINVFLKKNIFEKKNIFFFKNIFKPINDNIIEILMSIRNFKKYSSGKIFLVSPYLGYSRSDREEENVFNCVSAKLLADLLETVGLDGLLTVDLHTKQISSFYKIPVINISTFPIVKKIINKRQILFPDFGSVKRFNNLIIHNDYNYSVIYKYRNKNKIKSFGKKKKKNIILIDDIIDTGKTLLKIFKRKNKQKNNKIYATHAVFSKSAKKIIKKIGFKKIYTTNTIERKKKKYFKLKKISKLIYNEIIKICVK